MATIVDKAHPQRQIKISTPILYTVVVIFALIWLFPLWITITTAVKSTPDFVNNAFWLFPREFNLFQNMAQAWSSAGLGQGFVNSIIYGVVGGTLAVLIAGLASA